MGDYSNLIAAEFSRFLGGTTVLPSQPLNVPGNYQPIPINQLFHMSAYAGGLGSECIHIKVANGSAKSYPYHSLTTIGNLKESIKNDLGIPPSMQRLIYNGDALLDEQITLVQYKIPPNSTLHLVSLQGGFSGFYLDDNLLDSKFDHDFTNVQDDGVVFERGKYRYYRPYGWMRIALKVQGKYENDVWLGKPAGYRTYSSPGEWPVSYHGTGFDNAKNIVKEGFRDDRLVRGMFGQGHYSTPKVEVAERFARSFHFEGANYRIVLQNRICMTNTDIIPEEKTRFNGGGVYYVTPRPEDLRPYGFLIKKI